MRISDWSSDVCSSDLIYDLDRTVLRTPTFTLFLLWAAWREARWRLLLLPALAALMIGHALRLYGRERFKPAAIRLMLGASIAPARRSEEHTSELQSLMRISYAVFCLKKKKYTKHNQNPSPYSYKTE